MPNTKLSLQQIANSHKKAAQNRVLEHPFIHMPSKTAGVQISPGLPISYAVFNQNDFIKTINHKYGTSPSLLTYLWKKDPILDETGACAGLLMVWYDKLRNHHNLLDMLSDKPSKDLIQYINSVQKKCNWLRFKYPNHILMKYKSMFQTISGDFKGSDIYHNDLYNKMGFLECVQADVMMFDPEIDNQTQLKKYFGNLQSNNQECIGLHIICVAYEKQNELQAHVFGWTALENHYVLFDADKGEILFNNFEDLKIFISSFFQCIKNMTDDFTSLTNRDSFWITTENFYFPEDIEALAQHEVIPFSSNYSSPNL